MYVLEANLLYLRNTTITNFLIINILFKFQLPSIPKFKFQYRDKSELDKNISETYAYDSDGEQEKCPVVETHEFEMTEFCSDDYCSDDQAACRNICKEETSGVRSKPRTCSLRKDENPRPITKISYCADDSEYYPEQYVVTEEGFEVFQPDNNLEIEVSCKHL